MIQPWCLDSHVVLRPQDGYTVGLIFFGSSKLWHLVSSPLDFPPLTFISSHLKMFPRTSCHFNMCQSQMLHLWNIDVFTPNIYSPVLLDRSTSTMVRRCEFQHRLKQFSTQVFPSPRLHGSPCPGIGAQYKDAGISGTIAQVGLGISGIATELDVCRDSWFLHTITIWLWLT